MADSGARRRWQRFSLWLLPVIVIGGLFWPYLGYAVAAMMVFFLTMAVFRGRFWCGWFCPRGAFLEVAWAPLSRRRQVPAFFKSTSFRWAVFVLLMAFMLLRVWQAGTDAEMIGAVFITMCLLTTLIALPLGVVFQPRTWCTFCPMGTLQGVLGGERNRITVGESCVTCGACATTCPVDTYAGAYKDAGAVPHDDCLQCRSCVDSCPTQSLR